MASRSPLPYQDVTLKARITNWEQVEERLGAMAARLVGVDHQVDRYYQVSQGKLKWRKGTIENLITHYERKVLEGVEQTFVYRYDLNPDSEAIEVLRQSHREIGIVEKERRIYWVDNVKVHIDRMLSDELFLEIEAIDQSNTMPIQVLMNQCRYFQHQLGIADGDLIKTGYYTR